MLPQHEFKKYLKNWAFKVIDGTQDRNFLEKSIMTTHPM